MLPGARGRDFVKGATGEVADVGTEPGSHALGLGLLDTLPVEHLAEHLAGRLAATAEHLATAEEEAEYQAEIRAEIRAELAAVV